MGKQLGSGAFGVVVKAEAIGIGGCKGRVPVAVKMLKGNLCLYKMLLMLCAFVVA